MFSKDLYCKHVKTRACLGKGKVIFNLLSANAFNLETAKMLSSVKGLVWERAQ